MPRKSKKKKSCETNAGNLRLSEWAKRMEEVDTETQSLLDEFYRTGPHKEQMRFAEGQEVICLSRAFYYQAQVFAYYQTELPDSLFPAGTLRADIDPNDWTPTVIVHFKGYPDKDNQTVHENELFSCRAQDDLSCHLQGMLFAHEWNLLQRARKGIENGKLVKGEWSLPPEAYRGLENHWKEKTGQNVAFAVYCGREVENVNAAETSAVTTEEIVDKSSELELSEAPSEEEVDDFLTF